MCELLNCCDSLPCQIYTEAVGVRGSCGKVEQEVGPFVLDGAYEHLYDDETRGGRYEVDARN